MNAATAETWPDEPSLHGKPKLRELLEPIFARLGLSAMGLSTLLRTAQVEERPSRRRLRSRVPGGHTTYLVLDGLVRLQCRIEHRCRPLIVDLVAPGELISVFPEAAGARDDLGFYPHGAVLLAHFPEVVLRSVLRSASPESLLDLIGDLRGREARRLADKSRLLVRSVEDRVRVSIRALAARFGVAHPAGQRIAVGLTCGDWADLVGCERANATRALLHLERRGVIRREGRHVVVVDPRGLDQRTRG